MPAKSFFAACFFALSLLVPITVGAATVAGSVEFIEGEVKITRASADIVPKVGDTIQEGDTITTGKDGELHVRMEDQGFIALRPNTRMKIDGYRAEGDQNDKSLISLFTGTFRSVTGWIGKYARKNYLITTPSATLGIRGTDHEPLYIPEGTPGAEGEPGTYDKVNEGETFIQNPRGRVFISPKQSGFVPYHGRAAPRLLKAIPKFFRPTRNESRIEKRREILKQHLEQRFREKHRQAIEKQKALREKHPGELRERRQEHEGADPGELRRRFKEREAAEGGEARRDRQRAKQREEAPRRRQGRREAEPDEAERFRGRGRPRD